MLSITRIGKESGRAASDQASLNEILRVGGWKGAENRGRAARHGRNRGAGWWEREGDNAGRKEATKNKRVESVNEEFNHRPVIFPSLWHADEKGRLMALTKNGNYLIVNHLSHDTRAHPPGSDTDTHVHGRAHVHTQVRDTYEADRGEKAVYSFAVNGGGRTGGMVKGCAHA